MWLEEGVLRVAFRNVSAKLKESVSGYLFVLPAVFFFVIFTGLPIVSGIVFSFYKTALSGTKYIGLDNYLKLFKDEHFIQSIINTVIYTAGTVPSVIIFSFLISLVIYDKSGAVRSFYRAVFYLPAVCSIVSICLVAQWIYDPTYGLLNFLIGLAGIPPVNWLGSSHYAIGSLIFLLFVLDVGQPVILYVASIGNIPAEYIESSQMEGASGWQKLSNIYWPLVLPTTLFNVVITTIYSFQTFVIVQLLTGGGPYYRTSTIMFQLYQTAFIFQDFSLASAMGVVLCIIVACVSVFQYRLLSTEVQY